MVDTSNIKISFWDRSSYEFTTYHNINNILTYHSENYKFIDNCVLGSLSSIVFFEGESNLYNFTTTYKAIDVTGSYKLIEGTQFDRQRNSQRRIFVDRQTSFLHQSINEYLKFYNEIKHIYMTGIYSPCYAIPGWSQNTSYLNLLRNGLLGNSTSNIENKFPYSSI